jgi:AcrR family transcriptional regulator
MSRADDNSRNRVMQAAADELRQSGPDRMRIVDVAARAGMTHPNVYRHFTSKLSLIDALIAQWLRPLEERIEMVIGAPDPVADKLERMVLAISREYRAAKNENPMLFQAFIASTAARRPVIRKHRSRLRRAFDRVMDEGIGAGTIAMKDRARAQNLLVDATWRFTDPAAILAEQDESRQLDERLERVIAACLELLIVRRFEVDIS